MITLEQQVALAQGGESETLEFKRGTGELRSGMHALTALKRAQGLRQAVRARAFGGADQTN